MGGTRRRGNEVKGEKRERKDKGRRETVAKVIWQKAALLRSCYLGKGKSYGVCDGTVG